MSTPAKKVQAATAQTDHSAATAAQAPVAMAVHKLFDPNNVKIARVVTVPLLKLRAGDVVYIKALKPMYEAKPLKNGKADDKAAPWLMDVVELQSGSLHNIILGTVLRDIFADEYPNGAYVGKGFKIVVGEQKASQAGGGKRYNQYEVYEIEI